MSGGCGWGPDRGVCTQHCGPSGVHLLARAGQFKEPLEKSTDRLQNLLDLVGQGSSLQRQAGAEDHTGQQDAACDQLGPEQGYVKGERKPVDQILRVPDLLRSPS